MEFNDSKRNPVKFKENKLQNNDNSKFFHDPRHLFSVCCVYFYECVVKVVYISIMFGFSRAQLDQINQHPKSKEESKVTTLENELQGLCFLNRKREDVTWPRVFMLFFGVRGSLQDADLIQYCNFPQIPVI